MTDFKVGDFIKDSSGSYYKIHYIVKHQGILWFSLDGGGGYVGSSHFTRIDPLEELNRLSKLSSEQAKT